MANLLKRKGPLGWRPRTFEQYLIPTHLPSPSTRRQAEIQTKRQPTRGDTIFSRPRVGCRKKPANYTRAASRQCCCPTASGICCSECYQGPPALLRMHVRDSSPTWHSNLSLSPPQCGILVIFEARSAPGFSRVVPVHIALAGISLRETAHRRVSHQGLEASALLRVACRLR